MCAQVRQLANSEECQRGVGDVRVRLTGRGRRRAVSEEGDIRASKNPVVGAVFKEVRCGHCCSREAVDEECFELPFQKVDSQEGQRKGLEIRWGRREEGVCERVDKERAKVFEDEHGAPGQLRT